MKDTKEITDIIREKNFKTFWHCFDYLLLAGYSSLDAFGVTLKEFGEGKIFSDVAFIRYDIRTEDDFISFSAATFINYPNNRPPKKPMFVVGLVNEENVHLQGLFEVYREVLRDNKLDINLDIESLCERIKITDISPFIIEYLKKLSFKHFGYYLFSSLQKGTEASSAVINEYHGGVMDDGLNAPSSYTQELRNRIHKLR